MSAILTTAKPRSRTWLVPWNGRTAWLVIFCLLVFGADCWLAFGSRYSPDEGVFSRLSHTVTPAKTRILVFIAFWAKHTLLIPAISLLILLFLLLKDKKAALSLFFISTGGLLLFSLLKRLIHRPRPEGRLVEGITNFSFPSGHAFMSVCLYGFLIYLSAARIRDSRVKAGTIILLILFMGAIGYSRVYLRVHYVTDVLAGWATGTAWILLAFYLLEKKFHTLPD